MLSIQKVGPICLLYGLVLGTSKPLISLTTTLEKAKIASICNEEGSCRSISWELESYKNQLTIRVESDYFSYSEIFKYLFGKFRSRLYNSEHASELSWSQSRCTQVAEFQPFHGNEIFNNETLFNEIFTCNVCSGNNLNIYIMIIVRLWMV